MDVADLRIFEAVARLGAINRAATELNTVQSNVTTRIRKLEEDLGTALFDRHSRGVTLTAAGHRLMPYAQRAGHFLDDARRAVRDDGEAKGLLTLGSLESTAALRLSPILTTFAADYPDVDLVLRTGTTEELIAAVLAREVEGAFVCGPVDHRDLLSEAVYREEMVVATAPSVGSIDDLVRRGDLKIVVLRSGCSYRRQLERILERRGIVGLRQLEFGTIDAIVGCVAAGLGVTLLPKGIMDTAWRDGRVALHELPADDALAETVFIRHRDAHHSTALARFLDCARPALVHAVSAA